MDTCTLPLGSIDDTLAFLAEKGYVDELYDPPEGLSYRISKKGRTVLRYCNNTQDAINVTAYLKIN